MQQQKMRAQQQESEREHFAKLSRCAFAQKWSCKDVVEFSWCTFVEFVERPLRDGQRIEYGLSKIRAAQGVQPGVRRGPDDVAIPLDKYVVHGAVVASEFFQIAALRRNEVRDFFRPVEIADVVAAKPGDEIRIGDKFLPRFPRRFQVRRIVCAEASALEAK